MTILEGFQDQAAGRSRSAFWPPRCPSQTPSSRIWRVMFAGTWSGVEPMTKISAVRLRWLGLAALLCAVVGGGILGAMPVVGRFLGVSAREHDDSKDKDGAEPTHDLVRDDRGYPLQPPTVRLPSAVAGALGIGESTTFAAQRAVRPLALPPQMGTLAYDSNRLYPVRPLFAGEVADIARVALEEP